MTEAKASEIASVDYPELCIWMGVFGCLAVLAEQVPVRNYVDCNEALLELARYADQTHRFDLVLPCSILDFEKVKLPKNSFLEVDFYSTFWKWYTWWYDYLASLDSWTRNNLDWMAQLKHHASLKSYRPPGDWIFVFEPIVPVIVPRLK